ncbi:tail sheath (endogenous virus) [Clostridium phage phiCTC2B]|uniref:Phage-like element pbsx protein xkdK n=1 Tax=Clostridium tetani (strain Massachusetts / E88) TaxID=212717 RepID=Q892H4_CLOTE|nr:phage tail sheath subtilisin-like domain-containing protein [Clostridium tetani]YP_009217935.1 tail sheath [Clostridium phage phiCT453B]YP_009276939.1 tail sheath [Clostridium phage phiCT19406B]YP_009277383.1 tail sheath [Clostridium phage phiCTC2B]AAO36621.1 phage-like element pbsx protein xkdK [Clostridium tetani E88]AJA42591.1 tail sheath protein [Clostridium phage phiCT453B]AJA42799.1 xkdK-like tail sheath protein [Clostridium phage phiCT19406B]AJA42995.1 xkdK-like tail sheath protein
MGLPNIDIVFKSLAKSAIERGSKGTVALVLKDKKVIDKVITLESVKDTPKELSTENKEQIELAFKGGYKTPKKVIFYCLGEEGVLEDALNVMEAEVWDYIAIPCIQEGEVDKVATWIKGLREDNIKVQAVLPNGKADNEGIINFTTTPIQVGEKEYTNTQYCSRLAGIFAGTPLNISATYYVLNEVTDVPHLRKSEIDKKINNGELVLINDGEKCKIGRAVNSLTSTIEGKGEEYKKIKIVSTMDLIDRDIRKTFEDDYVSKYGNGYDNQVNFVVAVNGYLEGLEQEGILAKRQNNISINVDAIKKYWTKKQVDVSKLNKKELEELSTGSNVFLKGKIRILDAMEDLEIQFEM